jgi:hypothetical protein
MDNAEIKRIIESDSSETIAQIQDVGVASMLYGIVWGCVALSIMAYAAMGGM